MPALKAVNPANNGVQQQEGRIEKEVDSRRYDCCLTLRPRRCWWCRLRCVGGGGGDVLWWYIPCHLTAELMVNRMADRKKRFFVSGSDGLKGKR